MNKPFRFVVLALVVGFTSALSAPITTGTLVQEMTDLARLGEMPSPSYRMVQYSSTDRRSGLAGGEGWHANSDGFGNEPIPNFEAVLREPNEEGLGEFLVCDVEGPGALVRTWTARINGTIRMYLDDQDSPVFEGPADVFFDRPYEPYLGPGTVAKEDLTNTFQQRQSCYFPIPFATRCRVVWEGNIRSIHFYEVQFRLYEEGTTVESFGAADLVKYQAEFRRAATVLRDPDGEWTPPASANTDVVAIGVPARSSKEALRLEGARRVNELRLRVQAADMDRALRQTVLHLRFDHHPWGQVQCPVGDFFGAAPGINPYQSLPFTVRPGGEMICRFPMPFARSLQMEFENRGDQPVTVTGSISTSATAWDEARSLHFRARWRVDHDLLNSAVYDLPFLMALGQGQYVGTTSILMNPNPVPTPYGNWWGEGDEKIFVDGEALPSFLGTGSEDYYNYAWSSPDIFIHPYCGQPRNDGPGNRGFVTNYRWHILDPIPFEKALAFYMEFFSHERTPGYSYARVAYHYARPGVMDDHVPLTDEDLRHLVLPRWEPEARAGAANAVFHAAESLVGDRPDVSLEQNNLYAGGTVLVWRLGLSDRPLTMNLPVEEDGRYVVGLTARLSPGSGAFTARLGDTPLDFGGAPVNLQRPHRTLLRNFLARPVELKKGVHRLTIEGQPPADEPAGGEIGLDFIWVQKR